MAQQTPSGSGEPLTIQRITPYSTEQRIELASSAFPPNGTIPERHCAYGEGLSPPLSWNVIPGAQAYAIILEDPDAPRAEPFLHWTIWDIPGDVTSLPERLPQARRLDNPQGAIQGRNDAGGIGYFGPRPPAGDRPHRYHFQIFALGSRLGFDSETPLQELVNALKGDVMAKGELIGLYQHRVQ
jgi:Raf kinase inhibitor-like YbhB/YbcL family protein